MTNQRSDVSLAAESVPEAFDRVAARYDLLQRLNPGYHKHLLWSARRLRAPTRGRLLDLCCGTGLSTQALAAAYPHADIVAVDASARMLAVARGKPLRRVWFVRGDAMDPEAAGVTGPFDGVLMAYGVRNVPDADRCLARLRELLRPGAAVVFHEYSVAGSRWSEAKWKLVCDAVIIPGGRLATGSGELFRYLRHSVLAFDSVPAFEARLARAGFAQIETLPMDGWQAGIVHSFRARRPELDS